MSLTTQEIIDTARVVVGNELENREGEGYVPDEAVEIELAPVIRKVNQRFGGASGLKEVFLTVVQDQQDYAFTAIASDVKSISEVMRSDADTPDGLLFSADGTENLPFNVAAGHDGGAIPSGLQGNVFDTIIAQRRAERASQFTWESFGTTLRLFPPPSSTSEVIAIRYVPTGADISTLPDSCKSLLVFAACKALLEGELNRLNRTRVSQRTFSEADAARAKLVTEAVKRYGDKYSAEWSDLH